MALNALLKFTQGLLVGDGQALAVEAGTPVIVSNSTGNTDVGSWKIELLFAPFGSSEATIVAILKTSSGTGTPPSWTFTPTIGVFGMYRVRLTVYSQPGLTGTADVDIRNVAVVTPNQKFLVYPPQLDPPPLPPTGVGSKPNEFNFGGQTLGWAGDDDTDAKGLNQALLFLDSVATGSDQYVRVTGADTTSGFLDNKLTLGNGLAKTVQSPGSNEYLELRLSLNANRVLWVDPASTITPANGSITAPFTTLAAAIAATTSSGSWQVMLLPAVYTHSGLVIPPNRRIRFVGCGANAATYAAGGSGAGSTSTPVIENNGVLEIQLNSPAVNIPSELSFEDISFRNAPFDVTDTGNTNAARHLLRFKNCRLDCTIVVQNVLVATSRLELVFDGDQVAGVTSAPFTSYLNGTLVGPLSGGQIRVSANHWAFFTVLAYVSSVNLSSCVLQGGAVTLRNAGGELSTLRMCRILGGTIDSDAASVVEVDAYTMWFLRRNGQAVNQSTIRLMSTNTWTAQTNWYINPSSGSDDNSGLTSGSALSTFGELQRRWGPDPVFTSDVYVYVLASVNEGSIKLKASMLDGATMYIMATTGLIVGSEIATIQHAALPTTDARLTATGIADWSAYIGKRLSITTGPSGQTWVTSLVGPSSIARIGQFGVPISNVGWAREDTIAVGDDFRVDDLKTIAGSFSVDVAAIGSGGGSAASTAPLVVENFEFIPAGGQSIIDAGMLGGFTAGNTIVGSGAAVFKGCSFGNSPSFKGHARLLGCYVQGTGFTAAYVYMQGCTGNFDVQKGAYVVCANWTMMDAQGATPSVRVYEGGSVKLEHAGFFNSTSGPLLVVDAGAVAVSDSLWGLALGSPSVRVDGDMWLGAYPVISAPFTQVAVGPDSRRWTDTPWVSLRSGARVGSLSSLGFRDLITQVAVTADTIEWNPTSWGTAELVRVTSTAARTIRGARSNPWLALNNDPNSGVWRKLIVNANAVGGASITFTNQDAAAATPMYRFLSTTNADVVLAPSEIVELVYDSMDSRWRIAKLVPGSGSSSQYFDQISPAPGATEDNYSPTGWNAASFVRLSPAAASAISGFSWTVTAKTKKLTNISAFNVTLRHQNAGSVVANRMIVPGGADLILAPNDVVDITYDSLTASWRVG